MFRIMLMSLVVFVSVISFSGCTEQINEVQDYTLFEKRTPLGNQDSLRRPPIDSVKRRMPLQSALPCLNLTREQRIIIDSLILESKQCERECKMAYSKKAKEIRETERIKLSEFRGMEKDTLVREKIKRIVEESRKASALAKKEFVDCMKRCENRLFESIEYFLTKEQLTLWNIWKVTGRIPCERKLN